MMNSAGRPLAVTIIALVYIIVGVASLAGGFDMKDAFGFDNVAASLVRFSAIVCGAFMLRGSNRARWFAVAWMAFHVIVSAWHSLPEFTIHALFCAAIAWFLFRPEAGLYFRVKSLL